MMRSMTLLVYVSLASFSADVSIMSPRRLAVISHRYKFVQVDELLLRKMASVPFSCIHSTRPRLGTVSPRCINATVRRE